MKRLYVSSRAQGRGLGRALCEALIASARSEGRRLMRLDTADRLHEAIALYHSLGFRPCPAYNLYPVRLQPYVLFMERHISA